MKMDAKLLKIKNAVDYNDDEEDYTSDEMIYSDDQQSDVDDDASQTGNNYSKRLQTYRSNSSENQFHNRTKITSKATKSTLSIKRMPTRKPDPKISNRNAIMARENRRKKKEHMEVLQKTVEEAQNENKKLRKMLNIRNNTINKLTQESLYLRSILANKTEIMSLLRCIQGAPAPRTPPITSSALSFVADDQDYRYNTAIMAPTAVVQQKRRNSSSGISIGTISSGCSPASSISPASYIEDDKENDLDMDGGSEGGSGGSRGSTISSLDDINDFTSTENTDEFQWENLLNEPVFKSDFSPLKISDIRDIDDSEILSTNSSNTVKIEHNYFNNPITNTNKKVAELNDRLTASARSAVAVATASTTTTTETGASTTPTAPGVCLHVSNGRVSLEFCATCHQNSQNAWCEEM